MLLIAACWSCDGAVPRCARHGGAKGDRPECTAVPFAPDSKESVRERWHLFWNASTDLDAWAIAKHVQDETALAS